MSYLDTLVPDGTHVYDIRFKVTSGTNAAVMYFSNGVLFTLDK